MVEQQSPESQSAQEAETNAESETEPMNRAERRAAKQGKGKNEAKGLGGDTARSGFNPKRIATTSHKEFTNRKSG